MFKLLKVKGDSLFPLYKNSQILFCINSKFFKLKKNDILVFFQKDYGLMVKILEQIKIENEKKEYYMIGTNPSSIDSRNFGFIKEEDIKYKVLFKLV